MPCLALAPVYGAAQQRSVLEDKSKTLDQAGVTRLQKIIGLFYYYARVVDPTMMVALGELASMQTLGTATEQVAKNMVWFLNYTSMYPNAMLLYRASNMVLHVDSNASYLLIVKAQSSVNGHFYLCNQTTNPNLPPSQSLAPNGPAHTVCGILQNVIALTAKAKVGALF